MKNGSRSTRREPRSRASRRGESRGESRGDQEALKEETWAKYLATRRRALKHKLVELHMPLVHTLAEQLAARLPRSVDSGDLAGAGVLGLYKAVENFDPKHNARFETYARLRVRGAMIDFLRQQDWIPREARNRGSRLNEVIEELTARLGREPTELEVARKLGVSLKALRTAVSDLSFSTMVSLTFEDSTSDDRREPLLSAEDGPPDILNRRDLLEVVEAELTDVERRLVKAYYYQGLTLKAIGKKEGISESRVCQIHGRMLDRLAERLEHAT